MGNRTTIAESTQFNNNSSCRVKEFAADVCILDCKENDKSISDISVIMHEDRRTIETNQPHKNEDKRSKPHNTNLCKNAVPNLSSDVAYTVVSIHENSDTDQTMNQNNDISTHCQLRSPSEDFGRNLTPEWIGSLPLIEINVPSSNRSFIRIQQQASQNQTNQPKRSARSKLPMHDQDFFGNGNET
jgi:hypothetical protein